MIVKVFSVYDSKAKCFRYPFFMQSAGQAIRAFIDIVNDPKAEPGKFPEDFTLFEHGTFDDDNGVLVSLDTPVSLGLAVNFKKSFVPFVDRDVKVKEV